MLKRRVRARVWIPCLALVVMFCVSQTRAEAAVAMKDLPKAARAAAEGLIAGGTLNRIVRETEEAGDAYSVEASIAGKHKEFTLAADGTLLAEETELGLAELPEAVRAAAEKYFGDAQGLSASQELAKGVTSYEVEGKKNGKPISLTFSAIGALLEEENDED